MNIIHYIIIYLIFGFIGYLWELCVSDKKNIKLKLNGDTIISKILKINIPFINIYGMGIVLLLLIHKYIKVNNLIGLSLISGFVLTYLECISGYASLIYNKRHNWNYKDQILPCCDNFISLDVAILWVICSFIFHLIIRKLAIQV